MLGHFKRQIKDGWIAKLLTDDVDEERKLLIHIAFSLTDKSKVTFLVILHCRIPPPVPEAASGFKATLPWESITVT